MRGPTLIWAINVITVLDKGDILSTATSSAATTSLSPKPLNTAGFHPVANGLIDNPDTYVEDSDSVMAEPLDIL